MWDPAKYLAFADDRSRPFHELLSRVAAERPRRVVDLGCGPGNLTETLARRWPDSEIEAIDSSAEMVAAARERGIDARVGDVRAWSPSPGTDVVLCNAVLQWVPEHAELLAGWAAKLDAGAWLAFQVPGNFDAPSHRQVRALAAEPHWRSTLDSVLRDQRPVRDMTGYAELLSGAGCAVDAWETTYLHQLTGPDAVLEWITGTALRPIMSTLDESEWARFRTELARRLREAYPMREDGTTWFPFRRIFVVARR